jgi:two-component system, response regulator / RNA-binding antiterminator
MQRVLLLQEELDERLLREQMLELGYDVVAIVRKVTRLAGEVARANPDVIIVTTDTPSEATFSALGDLVLACPRPVVMFARDGNREVIRKAVDKGVCAYVVDGWAPARLIPIVEAAMARFEAHEALRKELASTRAKLNERKLIEKAKGLVMQQRKVSEDQAYVALRKMAMDQNLALAEVARRVIALAQLLA